jgi:lipopolysaccharide transport system ATP-binding protein
MSHLAIRVDNLSKRYTIRLPGCQHDTLRDALTDWGTRLLNWRNPLSSGAVFNNGGLEDFWALKNVSFEIKRGEVVGVIGRNGAGKSTLLKILSHITLPTAGRVEIHGRIGSLLEVGTGFHPELTGRENIYFNGAILGMKKAEIARKFDEIVAFAEIEKFIDTPVKRYSSGMYVRLAFAVAAHLEPEILIVDEVLAVGDGLFQKKCLNKMQDVGKQGRTVLFVSHNMLAITRLCEQTILLDRGRLVQKGRTHDVVSTYLTSGLGTAPVREWEDQANAPGGEVARLRAVRIRDKNGHITATIDIREPVFIEMEYDVIKPGYKLMPHFQFYNDEGAHAFSAHDLDSTWRRRPRPSGRYASMVEIPGNFLSEGTMFVGAGLATIDPAIHQFYLLDLVAFQVLETQDGGDSSRGDFAGQMGGIVRPMLKWSTKVSQHFEVNLERQSFL